VTDVGPVPLFDAPAQPLPAEVDAALTALVRRGVIPPPRLADAVIGRVNRDKLEFLISHDRAGAARCEAALERLSRARDDQSLEVVVEAQRHRLETRHHFLKAQRAQIEAEYAEKIARAREVNDERYEQLYEAQKDELLTFQAKWQDPLFLKQFNRPSARLLSLRQIEKGMALDGRFDEAKKTKAIADKIQAQEEASVEGRIMGLVKTEYARLRARQKKEAERMIRHDQKVFDGIQLQHNKELEPVQAAERRLARSEIVTAPPKKRPEFVHRGMGAPRAQSDLTKYRKKGNVDLRVPPIPEKSRALTKGGVMTRPKALPPMQ
jgi:hypothetical protein